MPVNPADSPQSVYDLPVNAQRKKSVRAANRPIPETITFPNDASLNLHPPIHHDQALKVACLQGNLYLIKKLIQRGLSTDKWTLLLASKSRNWELVKYLIQDVHLVPTKSILKEAIQGSADLDFIKFLLKSGITPDQMTMYHAYVQRNYELMDYLFLVYGIIPNDMILRSISVSRDRRWLEGSA